MMGFLLRWLFAFCLVTATYNPTPYNFTRWAMTDGQDQLSITVLAGLVLLVGYIIYCVPRCALSARSAWR